MRAVLAAAILLAVWTVGVWHGRTEERLDRIVATCPKVEARITKTGRLDTLTIIPDGCR